MLKTTTIRGTWIRLLLCVGLTLSFVFSPFTLQAQYRVVHMDKPYNTPGSETGAIRVGDTILAYSSMQPVGGRNSKFNFATSQMKVYQARIARSGKIARPRLSRWGINSSKDHTGNLALDPLNGDLYFTRARIDDATLRCDIWWARKLKRGWAKPKMLRGGVNSDQYTATHPSVARLKDSTTILFFVSNRPGGLGGMDIWYSIIKGGVATEPVNLGPRVNSPYDEITPFYDQPNGVLYFSSDRPGGKGGYDIYCAEGQRNTWQAAEPVCGCLNSDQNDIYFAIAERDSATAFPLAGYLSSNRSDSFFLSDSMCCNDIYRWELDTERIAERIDTVVDDVAQQSIDRRFMFPLFLYFHNDEPDPMSRSSKTDVSYVDCQRRYSSLRSEYIAKQTTAADSAAMNTFFDACVEGNFARVESLFDYIEEQLDEGRNVVLTISGYASPVFHSEYNMMLSKRRIESFYNMIRAWRGGMFADAMDDKRLVVVQQAHGAVEPTTDSQSADPVYGLPAALARRIEILSCEVKGK